MSGCNSYLSYLWFVLLTAEASYNMFDLPTEYTKNMPPMAGDKATLVRIIFKVDRISDIVEEKGEVEFSGSFEMTWNEHRLILNNSFFPDKDVRDYLNKNEKDQLWLPDLTIMPMRGLQIMHGVTDVNNIYLDGHKTIRYVLGFAPLTLLCSMDFSLYPLDVQKCEWKIHSFRHAEDELEFGWNETGALELPTKSTKWRIPEFFLEFHLPPIPFQVETTLTIGKVKGTSMKLFIYRNVSPHIMVTYFPSFLFVIISWGSFLVPPDMVPGRMVLLVTNILTLVTMFNSVRQIIPKSSIIKPIEVWLTTCILFLAAAFIEYASVLYQLRYSKQDEDNRKYIVPESLYPTRFDRANFQQRRHVPNLGWSAEGRRRPSLGKRKGLNRFRGKFSNLLATMKRRLNAGSPETIDRISLFLFPFTFLIFNVVYWSVYLSARSERLKFLATIECYSNVCYNFITDTIEYRTP